MGMIAGLIVAGVILWFLGITTEKAGIIAGVGGFVTKFLVDAICSNIQKKEEIVETEPGSPKEKTETEEESSKEPEQSKESTKRVSNEEEK